MQTKDHVTQHSLPEHKVKLFRTLFRGREDVYPRRFENRNKGTSGYSPVCAHEWIRGLCEKPKVKCLNCPSRAFLPVTDAVIRQHLSGVDSEGRPFVAGVYPMLLDESCYFLAMDFDKQHWQVDVAAVASTCREHAIPFAIERSRSGNGAHLWIFFQSAIPAILARKLGAALLTITMKHRPEVGLDSYDRFFPNQDTMPKGGLGNLIALPLQKQARAKGNTEFLDENFVPYKDQWAFLDTMQKLSLPDVESFVQRAEREGHVVGVRMIVDDEDAASPWLQSPSRKIHPKPLHETMPDHIELVLANEIFIPKQQLSPGLRNSLIRLAAFQNPAFYKAQAMRLPTFGTPRVIACAEDYPDHLALPRGCKDDVQDLLHEIGIRTTWIDQRHQGEPLDVSFKGTLRPDQLAAAQALLLHDTGVLSATTAFGKTVLAAWMIAQRGTNTLVLVHRKQLQEQWIERLSEFLNLSSKEIGRIGGGRKKPNGKLDVALIQSLCHKGTVQDVVAQYGHLVFDECHHLPAVSFEQVARRAKARYVLGLSATLTRKDGHHPIVFMQCGPIRHRVHARQQATTRPFTHSVHVRPTSFTFHEDLATNGGRQFHALYQALIENKQRNRQIVDDVLACMREGRKPVVLTERRDHLQILSAALSPHIPNLVILQGGMSTRGLDTAMQQLAQIPEEQQRLVLATGHYLGEGFDDARLDTLFLTLPISWRGTIAQYVGRLHRRHAAKREVRVYDYADLNVPMLARMFDRRCKGYEAVGYTLFLPASAVPGWPAEVPLPVDPEWKKDYAASIQRLVRDGVDPPLGNLFVHAAQNFLPDAEGEARARSASEAFLFRRLESLPATSGRFRLNQKIPIPFDQRGDMEVDFLAPDLKLVIELDGPQHFTDTDAYRRDRHKDALLQENRYFVLRFLTEDTGKNLNHVLDSIARTLSFLERTALH